MTTMSLGPTFGGSLSLAPGAGTPTPPAAGTSPVTLTYRPADPAATVTLFTITTPSGTVETTAAPTLQPDGTWTATVNLPDGSHILTATLTDTAGTYTDPTPDPFTTPARSARQPGEPLEPWVSVADLRTNTAFAALTDAQLAEAAQAATDLLWALSGRRFGGLRYATVLLLSPHCEHRRMSSWGGTRGYGGWTAQEARDRYLYGCGCSQTVRLPDEQISTVVRVTVDGVTVDPAGYRLDDRQLLVRLDGSSWPLTPNEAAPRLSVTYLHGTPPPAGGIRAARALATSYLRNLAGGKCGIPSRATSVTSDGVTIVLDDLDTYRQGGTGVTEADAWVFSVNPHRNTRQAAVLSPDGVRARRPYV